MANVVEVYAGEVPPDEWQGSVFLAGPMHRDPDLLSWRPEAVELLRKGWRGDGTLAVFLPEARDRHHPDPGYVSQLWEERWMAVVDVMLFWVPRNKTTLPGLNTNLEFGRNESSGRVVLGLPPEAVSVHYMRRGAEQHGAPVCDTLTGCVDAALQMVGSGAARAGVWRDVPLLVWRAAAFQHWRARLPHLTAARLLWAWLPAPKFELSMWAMQVDVDRDGVPTGEVLLSSPGAETVAEVPVAAAGLFGELGSRDR